MASSSGLGHDQVRRGAKYELSSLTSGDAQDFDELSIGVQDSQTKHPLQSYFQPAKRFSASAEEFVEADLAKGFAWPVNKLAGPRPVMERPHQRPAHHRLKRPLARPSSLPQGHGTSQPTDFSPSSFRPRAPLHLPELGIGGGSSADGQYDPTSRSTNHPEVGSQGEFSPSGSPIRLMPSSKEQPEQPEQPEQTFKPPPDSRISTCSTTEQIGSSTGSDYAEAGAIEWHDFEGLPAKADVGRGGDLAKSQHTANSPGLSESKRQGPKNSRAERLNESQPSTPVQLGNAILEGLKLPLQNLVHEGQDRRHMRSSSICGDLEVPSPQLPRPSRPTSRHRQERTMSEQSSSFRQAETSPRDRDRSQSRTSNTSRKRSSAQGHRTQLDPERRKVAMHNVAAYWNECLQIAQDEKDAANREIEKLQAEMRRAKKKLDKAALLLSKKDAQVTQVESLCETLQQEGSQAACETQRLTGEVQGLREKLSSSQGQTSELKERYSVCKKKLNEAIKEQQDLFQRSRGFYDDMIKQLEEEKSIRESKSKVIDQALENSNKKREELRRCFQESRKQMQSQAHEKDLQISSLETQLQIQEVMLSQEQKSNAEMSRQVSEKEEVRSAIRQLQSQIEIVAEGNAQRDLRDREQAEASVQFSEKLDSILEQVNLSTQNEQTSEMLRPLMERLEENIIDKILTPVLGMISTQKDMEKSSMYFQGDVKESFDKLHVSLEQQSAGICSIQRESDIQHQNLSEHLDGISTSLSSHEETCQQARQELAEWVQSQPKIREDVVSTFDRQVTELLQNRESAIKDLEERLQQTSDENQSKLDIVMEAVLRGDEKSKQLLDSTIESIRQTLDDHFEGERARSERDLGHSEAVRNAIKAELKDIKEQLSVADSEDAESQLLQETLIEERKKASALQERLGKLEGEAERSEDLRKRWHRDIQAIDSLKATLKVLAGRVPSVESLEHRFNNMARINQIMGSTATYLMTEHSWVSQQLQARTNLQETGAVTEQALTAEAHQEEPIERQEKNADMEECQSTIKDDQPVLVGLWDPVKISSSQELNQRRVVVRSPAGDVAYGPAPSIEQEQRKRREAATPRSILRPTGTSSQNSQSSANTSTSHTQYNRPVMAKIDSSATGGSHQWMEQIRFKMVPPASTRPRGWNWSLPKVTDFEQLINPSWSQEDIEGKKHIPTPIEGEPAPKKIKVEDDSAKPSIPPTGSGPRQWLKRKLIMRTYSRKKND